VDNTPPGINVSAPSAASVISGESVSYTVTYTGADEIFLSPAAIAQVPAGFVKGEFSVEGSGGVRTVTFTHVKRDGILGLHILAQSARDAAGNWAEEAFGASFETVDLRPRLHVDFAQTGTESGTSEEPYSTLGAAVSAVSEDSMVFLHAGDSAETLVITKPMDLLSVGGPVRIGVAGGAPVSAPQSRAEAAVHSSAQSMTLEEIAALLAAHFAEVDLDGDGVLSAEEIRAFLESWGIPHTEALLAALLLADSTDGAAAAPGFQRTGEAPGDRGTGAGLEETNAPRAFGCDSFFNREASSLLDLFKALWPLLMLGLVLGGWRWGHRQ